MPIDEALDIAKQICEALEAARRRDSGDVHLETEQALAAPARAAEPALQARLAWSARLAWIAAVLFGSLNAAENL